MKIETSRLILRPFQADDAEGMFLLNHDPEVIRYTGDPPFLSIDEARQFILAYPNYKKHGYGRLSVLVKPENVFIGWCGLKFNEDIRETDIGFRLLKSYWNKGYATEAAKACLDVGFQSGISKIIGRAVKENQASIRVLKKLGMQFECEFLAHGFICEQYVIHQPNDKN